MDNNQLVENNINIVHKIAHQFHDGKNHHDVEYEDLFSEGCVALVEASRKYRPSSKYKWAKFSTFAYHCVKMRLIQFVSNVKQENKNISLSLVPEKYLSYNNTESCISQNMPNLSPGMQQVLQLRIQGYTIPEIASIVIFPNGRQKSAVQLWRKIKTISL